MFVIDQLIAITGVMLLLGIVSSKFSTRVGLPVLVLFVVLGMLGGSEGLGGIAFEDYGIAHAIGTIALALILFDGGLRTTLESIRMAWRPSLLLATIGVVITSLVTGLAAAFLLGIPLLEGMLLGSIIGSTDAAAVFAVLRSAGVKVRPRIAATLEIESASNDPMAIFLTVALLEILLGQIQPDLGVVRLFVVQMGVGSVVGLAIGFLSVRVINRVNLEAAGLYPVLTLACGLIAFGLTAFLGGSGFLAIYLAGIVIGTKRTVFQRGTFLFHDGLAWIGQITMFVVLGLLSFPSRVWDVAWEGVLIALVLTFIARPIAVVPLLLPFRYSVREILLISWVGLKGAVPIVLATYPLLYGLPGGVVLFNIVFVVVLISAVTQGWSLPIVARFLGLAEESGQEAPVTLDITSLREVDADIVQYAVGAGSRASGRKLSQLSLPDGVVVAMISRDDSLIPPRGSTRMLAGDHVFVVLRPEARPLVDRVFGGGGEAAHELPEMVEFPLAGRMTIEELWEFYGIRLGLEGTSSLGDAIIDRLGPSPSVGASLVVDGVILRVREVSGEEVVQVGLVIPGRRS